MRLQRSAARWTRPPPPITTPDSERPARLRELVGKTAFVTGGASGIGFALGRALAEAGMKVMLADIETDALAAAVADLQGVGPDTRGITCDVADPVSVERAAEASYAAFGNVHVVCNNAGVGGGSGIDDISLDTWRWVLDVNVMGVLHAIRTFLPHTIIGEKEHPR
jgi:NAD(P)-dependent dehydrogenase (short-subunit alcohol dehydrogenase family)